MNFIFKRPLLSLFIFSVLAFFMHLTLMPVSIMEARNFLVTREMLLEGNWLLTTMNGLPRYEKPPLPAWITSLFVRGNIDNVFWYRLPTSIISTLGVFLFYILTKMLTHNKTLSFISAIVLGSSFYYVTIIIEAPSDVYTHVFMLFGIVYLIKLYRSDSRHFFYFIISVLGIAASIVSKGPVSLYALILPFIISYAWVYKLNLKKSIWLVAVLLLGIGIGSSWFVYVRCADAKTFLEVATRESSNWTNYRVRPFYYYWSFLLQSGIWTIPALLSLFYPFYKNKVYNKNAYLFSWLWTILALVLLSLVPEKKSRYLLPVLFPLALTTAQFLHYQWDQLKNDKLSKIGILTHYSLLSLVCFATLLAPLVIQEKSNVFWAWYVLLASGGIGVGAYMIRHLLTKNYSLLFFGNVLLILFFTCVGNFGFTFAFNQLNHPSVNKLSAALQGEEVFYFEEIRPEISWETKTITKEFSAENVQISSQFLVLVTEANKHNFIEKLPDFFKVEKIETFESSYLNNKRNLKNKDNFIHHVFTISVIQHQSY